MKYLIIISIHLSHGYHKTYLPLRPMHDSPSAWSSSAPIFRQPAAGISCNRCPQLSEIMRNMFSVMHTQFPLSLIIEGCILGGSDGIGGDRKFGCESSPLSVTIISDVIIISLRTSFIVHDPWFPSSLISASWPRKKRGGTLLSFPIFIKKFK